MGEEGGVGAAGTAELLVRSGVVGPVVFLPACARSRELQSLPSRAPQRVRGFCLPLTFFSVLREKGVGLGLSLSSLLLRRQGPGSYVPLDWDLE